ncbi:MAG: DUF2666 family protein [Candidatus Micrarchaeia archaeon]
MGQGQEEKEEKEEEISFIANYKNWIVVKRMVIDKSTTPQEIASILASIRSSIDRKAFDFSGIKKEFIDSYVEKIANGKRATLNDLKKALEEIKTKELNEALEKASSENVLLKDVAKAYFLSCLLDKLGLEHYLSNEALSKAYPELKVPKPRGRLPKQK